MNHIITMIAVVLLSFSAMGQIKTTSVAKPVKQQVEFDSTMNFRGRKDLMQIIGKEVFILPKSESLQQYGYMDFGGYYSTYRDLIGQRVKYEDIAEKTFIIDTIEYDGPFNYSIIRMHQTDAPEKKYSYLYNTKYPGQVPFILMPYYNYLKTKYVGKKVIVHKKFIKENDLVTGNPIVVKNDAQTEWLVEDITILDDYKDLSLILKNGMQTTSFWVSRLDFEDKKQVIYTKEEWLKLTRKYGLSMMATALHGEICVGMPKELLLKSWGEPKHINDSSTGDQFVYDGQYVYVRGGKVTGWN